MVDRGYYNQTTLHPLGFTAILILGTALMTLPRRLAMLPIVVMACTIPPAQRIVVAGLDFDLLRIMILFGFARLFIKAEFKDFRWGVMDTAVAMLVFSTNLVYAIQRGPDGAVTALGTAFDQAGMYFLFRCLISNWEDVRGAVRMFIYTGIPVTLLFMVENLTGRNVFGQLGGVPKFTDVRNGRLRCQGAFAHSILAGCFWVSLLPYFIAQWWAPRTGKMLAVIGVTSVMLLVVLCSSSTPVAAVFFVCVGAAMFPFRHWLSYVRWGVLAALVALHFSMKAPVWHLVARIDLVGGSTGWHRYFLIDRAIAHFGEWWLLGTQNTRAWGHGMQDVTNQYVLVGVTGGAVSLAIFVWVLFLAFKGAGKLIRSNEGHDQARLMLSWALGVSLFTHTMIFFAVSYFGQIQFLWYMTLAIVGSLAPAAARARASRRAKPAQAAPVDIPQPALAPVGAPAPRRPTGVIVATDTRTDAERRP